MLGKKPATDQRIAALLEKLELDYDTDADGDFHAMLQIKGERYQQVVICSSTKRIGGLEIRKLYSVGYQSADPLSQQVANLLLGINHSSKLGAWQVMESKGEYYAAYNAQIAADTDAETLLTAIRVVVESADSIEAYLTGGKDVF